MGAGVTRGEAPGATSSAVTLRWATVWVWSRVQMWVSGGVQMSRWKSRTTQSSPAPPLASSTNRTATAALGGMGRLSGHYQREGSPCLVLAPELAERPGHTSSASRPPAPRKRTRQRTCGGTGSSGRGSGCVCLGGPGRDTRGGARIGPAWRSRAGPTPKIEFLHSTAYLPITSTTAHLS